MEGLVREALVAFTALMLFYFVVLDLVYTGLTVIGWRSVNEFVARRPLRDYQAVGRSPMTMPVSILVPAYNEAPVIAASVRSLLSSQFVGFEVVVINDGSSDATLDTLTEAFDLVAVARVPRAALPCKAIDGVYVSRSDPRVVVLDKENGGKADSLNAGLRFARYPLVCAIDADTMLDPGALSRLVWEFQAVPETVAVGGIVRVLNGSNVQDGRLIEVKTPKQMLVNLQIIEYLRAFLGGRIGWSKLGMLLIISGAFGLFRRDVVIEAGGYDTNTVGEDAELVLRLHRHQRDRERPCRVTFFPDPICWTEAPSSLRVLARQRDRWQRGLIQMVHKHRHMIGRRKYGRVGLLALPYFIVFEVIGPLVEVLGYLALVAALLIGAISLSFAALFVLVAVVYGLLISFAVVLMEERAFRRYPGWRCLRRLILAAIVENFGYRQLNALLRVRAWWTLARKAEWGDMTRVGHEPRLPGLNSPPSPDSSAG